MEKTVYLTTNKGKYEEAMHLFKDKYGFDIDIKEPAFEVLEIQATNCKEIYKDQ